MYINIFVIDADGFKIADTIYIDITNTIYIDIVTEIKKRLLKHYNLTFPIQIIWSKINEF